MSGDRPAAVIVLAAGGGTRMRSATPKVLHRIGGRSLLSHVMHAAAGLTPDHLAVVVRHQRDEVVRHVEQVSDGVDVTPVIADQDDVAGTGRAVQCGLAALPEGLTGTVVVTYGDVPLQSTSTLAGLVAVHDESGNAATVMTAALTDPFGYGRIVRDATGAVAAIVEENDATEAERTITEISSGIYAFDADALRTALAGVGTDNAQGEMYLTDVVAIARAAGQRVGAFVARDLWETMGVNTRSQLAALGRELNRRVLEHWMDAGVEVIDPATTWVDVTVTLAPDVSLRPGVQLHGDTRVATSAVVGPDTTLTDVDVGEGATVVRTHGSGAVIGPAASVGPYAALRPGTVIGRRAKVGTFVETKQSTLGDGAKVPHLSYVGDAEIGEGSNIGAGTIFANFDGVEKHRTEVGAHVKSGSNNTFVAPVTIGDGAATGGGTVVRRNVPPGALAVSTGAQRHLEGWVLRKRPGTSAAKAAEAAGAAEEEQS